MKTNLKTLLIAAALLSNVQPMSAFFDPHVGRWASRDPIRGESDAILDAQGAGGEWNLYALVQNDPVCGADVLGLWNSRTHKWQAQAGVEAGWRLTGASIKCWRKMEDKVVAADLSQDSIWGNLWHNERHYNRDRGADPNTAQKAYLEYLREETNRFHTALLAPSLGNCRRALGSLGLVTHSWQDFFAHGIRAGKWEPPRKGFIAWTVGVAGDPDKPGDLRPSSYSFWLGGEHPRFHEPIDQRTQEWQMRYDASKAFTILKHKELIPEWYSKCKCFCEKL